MTLITGDCVERMAAMDADSVDAVVTDPPYNLSFMGKAWDSPGRNDLGGVRGHDQGYGPRTSNPTCRTCGGLQSLVSEGSGGRHKCRCESPVWPNWAARDGGRFQAWCTAWAAEALRVTKPGGYLLAFGGTRTHHRLVCGLEDAGWIIRDELTWIYLSGFPKGRANLKPAHEPIVLARKPGPLRHLEIERCRIPLSSEDSALGLTASSAASAASPSSLDEQESATSSAVEHVPWLPDDSVTSTDTSKPDTGCLPGTTPESSATSGSIGRSGRTLTGPSQRVASSTTSMRTGTTTASRTLPASPDQSTPPSTSRSGLTPRSEEDETLALGPSETSTGGSENWNDNLLDAPAGRWPSNVVMLEGDGSALGADHSRYFVIPKADRGDREPVLRGRLEERPAFDNPNGNMGGNMGSRSGPRENSHPTVKPVDLMRHLVRLVTPPGGVVLDPFLGSGSTAIACELEGFAWVGIEKEPEYVAIAEARLNGAQRGMGLSA